MGNANNKVAKLQSEYITQQEANRHKKKKRRRGFFRRIFVANILFAIVLTGVIYLKVSKDKELAIKNTEQKIIEKQKEALVKEETNFRQVISNLNDPAYIQNLARQQFYLSKPGETIIAIPDEGRKQ